MEFNDEFLTVNVEGTRLLPCATYARRRIWKSLPLQRPFTKLYEFG